jgi:pilus assembly protein Flp/PilA
MLSMIKKLQGILKSEDGATAIEYGLIAAGIAVAIIAAVFVVGDDLSGLFNTVASNVSSANAN